MSLSKFGVAMAIGLIPVVGCAGASEDAPTSDSPAAEVAPADTDAPAAAADMLGGGALTAIHDGQAGSPHVRVDWGVSGANISIEYGRPLLKGRTVGDSVEPLEDKVWRLGADEATTLTTDRELMVGSVHVPAGAYTLFTVTTGDATELIVNSETGQWGTAYDESQDLGRTPMTVETLDSPADQLTLHIEDSVLRFEWGATLASVPIMVH
jgi:hypothetical protein